METRKIEAYIGYTNYQWDTKIIDIPLDTPELDVLWAIESKVLTTFDSKQHKISEIAFIGIYNNDIEDL